MPTFSEFAQMNVDHYNEHPAQHTAITVALGVGALVAINKIIKRIAKEDPQLRSGMYA